MAGTDHRRQAVAGGPAIILVEPQLGENIGTAARAMMNCALDDLRLVRPRDGWPSDRAIAAASGADVVLDRARLYPSVPAAIADLVHVYAATARDRGMVRREVTPRQAAGEMHARLAAGEACGVLFGPERTGLLNDDVTLADTVLTVPLNPGFSSLNLAQAVMIVGYEWFTAGAEAPSETLHTGLQPPGDQGRAAEFFRASRRGADPERLSAQPRKPPEHGAQSAQPVSARTMHRAGIAHLARRRHRLRRSARAAESGRVGLAVGSSCSPSWPDLFRPSTAWVAAEGRGSPGRAR